MKRIYVIFKFEDNKFSMPEVFDNVEEYSARLDELGQSLYHIEKGCEPEEWEEVQGTEISLRCADTIYRGYFADVCNDCKQIHLFATMKDDNTFELNCVEVASHISDPEQHFNNEVKALRERYENEGEYVASFTEWETPEGMKEVYLSSENGRCGYCEFGAMLCTLVVPGLESK